MSGMPDMSAVRKLAQRVQDGPDPDTLVRTATRQLREYTVRQDAEILRDVARRLVHLRCWYVDRRGMPDLAGRSGRYRDRVRGVHLATGEEPETVRNRLSYHVSTALRAEMRSVNATEGEYAYYRISRRSKAEKESSPRTAMGALSAALAALREVQPSPAEGADGAALRSAVDAVDAELQRVKHAL